MRDGESLESMVTMLSRSVVPRTMLSSTITSASAGPTVPSVTSYTCATRSRRASSWVMKVRSF